MPVKAETTGRNLGGRVGSCRAAVCAVKKDSQRDPTTTAKGIEWKGQYLFIAFLFSWLYDFCRNADFKHNNAKLCKKNAVTVARL